MASVSAFCKELVKMQRLFIHLFTLLDVSPGVLVQNADAEYLFNNLLWNLTDNVMNEMKLPGLSLYGDS